MSGRGEPTQVLAWAAGSSSLASPGALPSAGVWLACGNMTP